MLINGHIIRILYEDIMGLIHDLMKIKLNPANAATNPLPSRVVQKKTLRLKCVVLCSET
jgi:hypothetical protein